VRDAQAGKLSVVIKHGQPVFVAVPFDEVLLREGVNVAPAVKLFDEDAIILGQGTKLAGMTLAAFTEECSALEVPVVRHSPEDLKRELAAYDELHRR
jgi:predicted HTH domain antitoxin